VVTMAVVWARFHKQRVPGWLLSTNFLIVAPNVIVYQRLERDFAANRIFYELPLIPGVARRFQPKGDSAGRPRGARLVWQSLPHQHPPALRIARPGVNAAERHRGPPRQEAREGPRHLGAVLIFQFLTRFTGVPVAPGFCFMAGVGRWRRGPKSEEGKARVSRNAYKDGTRALRELARLLRGQAEALKRIG
jgi:hypothetical protein